MGFQHKTTIAYAVWMMLGSGLGCTIGIGFAAIYAHLVPLSVIVNLDSLIEYEGRIFCIQCGCAVLGAAFGLFICRRILR